jgi:COPII coat assembly protein SEC16
LDHLKGLSDRISDIPHVDKSGSWMGAKLSKPSLDTIGGWLEGRFTKLVTGDTDTPVLGDEDGKTEDRSFAGPFSHYSTISSNTPSARSSPQPSLVNGLPPARSGSAMASSVYHPQIDRSSSAMDYVKPKTSPAPRVSSANPATSTFSHSTSFGQSFSNFGIPNGYNASDDTITPRPAEHDDENTKQDANWWSSSAYDGNSTTQTPTASTFLRVDGNTLPSANGFISLMDNGPYSPASLVNTAPGVPPELHDDEDLGFGNSKRDKLKHPVDEHEGNNPSQASEPAKTETTGQYYLSHKVFKAEYNYFFQNHSLPRAGHGSVDGGSEVTRPHQDRLKPVSERNLHFIMTKT